LLDKLKKLLGSKGRHQTETDDLIIQYEKIISKNQNDKEAWMNLARAYSRKRDFEKAIECKLKAASISPNDSQVRFSLGCSYCVKGDFSAAIQSYLEALEMDPNFAEACECIAEQYQILGEYEKAEEWLSKAEEIRLSH
jgi:tetratricopeptide (TPR) repeat protein